MNEIIINIKYSNLLLIMRKTKPINKQNSKQNFKKKTPKKPITNQEGDPLIKNLSDFVTSLKVAYSSRPIYTGGRIIAMEKNLYSTCNSQISVYSFEHATVVDTIKHINEQIVNFCVCPQQKYIVSFTQNAMVRVLNLQTKKIIHTVKMHGNFANDIQFSSDGRHIAFAFGNSVHIFTFETMKRTHTYNPTNSKFVITKVQWHPNPDKLQIFTCDMQRNIAVFDYILNKVIATSLAGEGGTQFCLANNGEILVAVNNLQVKFYDTRNMNIKHTLTLQCYIESLYSIDTHIYLGGQQTELFSLNLSAPNKIKMHAGCTDNGVAKIMSMGKASNRKLLVLSTEQNISVLRICNNHHFEFEGMIVGYNDQIIDIKSSKVESDEEKEKSYFVIVTNSNNIKIMNKKTHRLQYLIKGHTNIVLCADFWYPFVATAGKDNTLKLWRINDELKKIDLLANYNGHSGDIVSLVALTQSKIIATVSQDFTIKLWPMCTDNEQKIQIKSAIRTSIAHQKSINAVRVSPKQDLLVTCSQDKTLKIWDQNLTNIMTLVGHKRGVWDAAFHPIQRMLVSAGGDGMLKGWNLQSGQCLWSMGEGAALIRCSWIYYNQVVTGSLSGIIKIWDIRKQTSLSYDKHEGKIWALDVTKSKEGKVSVMSGATDSMYQVWQDNTEEMKTNIMNQLELQEKQRIFYEQNMASRNYCEAALIAFKAGYTKLFFNVLERMDQKIDAEVSMEENEQGKLRFNLENEANQITEQQFVQLIKYLKQIDMPRLLVNLQAMASTIKLYKTANKMLLILLKSTNFSELSELNSKFILPNEEQSINQFNNKKSGLTKWLQSMISYDQKHSLRLQKYIIGAHWIDHLNKVDNPLSI